MGKVSSRQLKSMKLTHNINCPYCGTVLTVNDTYSEMNEHFKMCSIKIASSDDIHSLQSEVEVVSKTSNSETQSKGDFVSHNKNFLKKYNYPFKTPKGKENLSFDSILFNLKTKIQYIKKDWRNGSCNINVNRYNLISDSLSQLKSVDIFKELKINFLGEISQDAGGIIREWLNILVKELESDKLSKST